MFIKLISFKFFIPNISVLFIILAASKYGNSVAYYKFKYFLVISIFVITKVKKDSEIINRQSREKGSFYPFGRLRVEQVLLLIILNNIFYDIKVAAYFMNNIYIFYKYIHLQAITNTPTHTTVVSRRVDERYDR